MGLFEVVLLGAGLATDASCVCASNGMVYRPAFGLAVKMALVCAIFQFAMPVIGFLGASMLPAEIYQYNRLIACILLTFIGGKMIVDGVQSARKNESDNRDENDEDDVVRGDFSNKILLIQAVATSIDALSVGFAFTGMSVAQVLLASFAIALVTFVMCFAFVKVGVSIGDRLNNKAGIIGGVVLVALGLLHF